MHDARAMREEQVGTEIGANDVKLKLRPVGKPSDIQLADGDAVLNAIAACIGGGDADGDRIGIDGFNGPIPEFGGGDGQDAGATTQIQQRQLHRATMKPGDLPKTKCGGRMVAGSEAQPRIEDDFFLAGNATAPDPRRQDQE